MILNYIKVFLTVKQLEFASHVLNKHLCPPQCTVWLQCKTIFIPPSTGSKELIAAAADGSLVKLHILILNKFSYQYCVMYHAHLFNQKLGFDWEQKRWALFGIIWYVYYVYALCIADIFSLKSFIFTLVIYVECVSICYHLTNCL